MSEIRKDMVHDNWVITADHGDIKPFDFSALIPDCRTSRHKANCPFCEGSEKNTTPEVFALRNNESEPDTPGWSVRVVPNKFTAFHLQGELMLEKNELYSSFEGIGQHEVVVETPYHGQEFHQFSQAEIVQVLTVFQERYRALAADERIKYIQIYKNRGIYAGASMEHSHSQILGLPLVPDGKERVGVYYTRNHRCIICEILEQELNYRQRIVAENEEFVLFCPYASRFPYEIWLAPKRHQACFTGLQSAGVERLAQLLGLFMPALIESLNNPSYNLIINNAPLYDCDEAAYHWYIEITPRILVFNGLETSCGFYINPVIPEYSAELFRSAINC